VPYAAASVSFIEIIFVLLTFVAAITLAARRIGIPYPILMVLGGLVLGAIPGLPRVELDPEIVLLVFLPPILFSAAYLGSPRELWRNVRPISLLAFGLVLTTTAAVAIVMMVLVPSIGWPAAIALGAIVSPPDAIAATAIAQRLGLPRRLVTILEGESLVNDATALVTYRLAVTAIGLASVSFGGAAVAFVTVALGGLAFGLAVGFAVTWVLNRIDDPPVEVLISVIAPFAAYLPAEEFRVSGVLAAVTAGLILGSRAPRVLSSDTRILGSSTWQMITFVVNGLAFILIGLQLPAVLEAISDLSAGELLGLAAAVCLTVVVVRLLWVFPATYLPRILIPGLASRDPAPPAGTVLILGWAGMRGAVSLAAALALPSDVPQRDLLIFLTFAVIVVTLVGQGLTLPWLIRRVGLGDDGSVEHEELHAREAAAEAALARLEELRAEVPGHVPLIEQLREQYLHRTEHYERAHDPEAEPDEEERDHQAIRAAVLDAERYSIIDLRDRGVIGDETLRRVERDIDLEAVRRDV
jgi:monovalent cation/hydrogen antiporter